MSSPDSGRVAALSPSSLFIEDGTSELILDNDSEWDELGEKDEEDKSSDADDERGHEGRQQAVSVIVSDTVIEDDTDLHRHSAYAHKPAPVQTLPSPEWSLGSLPISPSSPILCNSDSVDLVFRVLIVKWLDWFLAKIRTRI
ncbi:hypothetical protein Tco_1132121 [Tanacetum coccineum]|uniref:Uncharacterized protein n=1 Tax=Tanacetum coccineum TaxID=301880 RepID=A0ABQ5JCQ5_9ASTR